MLDVARGAPVCARSKPIHGREPVRLTGKTPDRPRAVCVPIGTGPLLAVSTPSRHRLTAVLLPVLLYERLPHQQANGER